MELVYPFVIYIGVPIIILLLIWNLKKAHTYKDGKKIANTKYVKSIPYYNNIMKKYKMLSYLIKGISVLSIFLSLILLSRPAKVDTKESPMYSRDIFLCMDVSVSVNEVNKELVKGLKDIVKELKGERFGISIFNTSSVLVVPLTDDYDYVLSVLDTLEKSFEMNSMDYTGSYNVENANYLQKYIEEGTLIGAENRGSSIIGDGLATCIYNFTNLEENRTRIIIFSTDNELEGEELITLQKAAEIAKSKNITVYGIAPSTIGSYCYGEGHDHSNAEPDFKKAVQTTGGDLYIESSNATAKSIINNIEKQQKTLLQGQKETRKIDKPEVPFIMLLISLLILFILNKKVSL